MSTQYKDGHLKGVKVYLSLKKKIIWSFLGSYQVFDPIFSWSWNRRMLGMR